MYLVVHNLCTQWYNISVSFGTVYMYQLVQQLVYHMVHIYCTIWSIKLYQLVQNILLNMKHEKCYFPSFLFFLPFLLSSLLTPSVLLGLIPTALSLISVTVTVISLQCLHYTTYLLVTVCLEPLILDWKPQHLSTEPLGPIQYLKIKCFTVLS